MDYSVGYKQSDVFPNAERSVYLKFEADDIESVSHLEPGDMAPVNPKKGDNYMDSTDLAETEGIKATVLRETQLYEGDEVVFKLQRGQKVLILQGGNSRTLGQVCLVKYEREGEAAIRGWVRKKDVHVGDLPTATSTANDP